MRNSIRARLRLAFMSLAIGPLLLVGVVLAWQSLTVQQQQALVLERQLAQRVSTQVRSFIREVESDLAVVAKVRRLEGLDRDQQQVILSELLSYRDVFEEVALLDSQGKERVRLSRLEIVTPADLRDRSKADEFTIPKSSGETYYSPVQFEQTTNEPRMTIALPLLDVRTGLVDGVLVADIRFKPIWDLIAGIRVSEGESVYIVDNQGKVIAHRNPSVVLKGTRFNLPDQDSIQTGLEGKLVVVATDETQFGGQAFTIVAERSVSQALALAIRTMLVIAALIVVALVIAGGLGFLLVRQIVRPVQALVTTAQAISGGDLSKRAGVTSRDEFGELAQAFNSMAAQLRDLIGSLEQRVADRTRNLQAAAEVARATTSVLDPDELLRQVVDLVRERFNLYYVGLFLLDEERKFAMLRAGTGEAGHQMLAQGHRLEVGGRSMVGQCVARDEARIALDVGAEAVRFDNPFLPETRSEMALPLRSRGQAIGAMTVQSVEEAAFDEADIAVMQTMADQVAVAIDNARLFAAARAALQEMEATQQRYLGQAWVEYTRSRAVSGYQQSEAGMLPLDAEILPEVRQAMTVRHPVIGKDDGDAVDQADESYSSALVAPIVVRGQPIGALGFRQVEADRQWSADDVALAETIAEQLALALENTRLLEETQRRAVREQLVGQVTARMRETLDLEAVLKVAAGEMRQALGLDKLVVRLATKEASNESTPR